MVTLFPVLVTRSLVVVKSTKSYDFTSCSFIARFADGSEKVLNSKGKSVKGLIRECDLGEVVCSKEECCLYFRNWANNPTLGTVENNYPTL